MPSNPKFPNSVEIKRVIAATLRAGIEIGFIEIRPGKIVIHRREKNEPQLTDYDVWKMREGPDTNRIRHSGGKTDGPVRKPRG